MRQPGKRWRGGEVPFIPKIEIIYEYENKEIL